MRGLWLLALLAVTAHGAETETWRWVDERGVVHYSDRPHPGAERVDLRSVQSYEAPRLPDRGADGNGEGTDLENPYRRVAILQPGAGETLWNIGGRLDVQLDIDPSVRGAHRLQVRLDGEPVPGVPEAGTQFTIGNVFRGAHTLTAAVVDAEGRELAASAPVQFFVQQTSVQNPNNPNTPQNPATPNNPNNPNQGGGGGE
jgi:hypothetical protein